MAKLLLGTREVTPAVFIKSGNAGKYSLHDVITADNGDPVGVVCGFTTDSNGIQYAVVCLCAAYRIDGKKWCSRLAVVTGLEQLLNWNPSCLESVNTATENTQLILDYCSANNYTSEACNHCRSNSFIIEGNTYYGQLPTIKEVISIRMEKGNIDNLDVTVEDYSQNSFSSVKNIVSSSQRDASSIWYSDGYSDYLISTSAKNATNFICPVIELPNTL